MNIDPRYLANLLSISKHGSINRAAAALGISQPALSNSIAQLERRLGVAVLDRTRRGSSLNDIGKILIRNAEIIESVLRQTGEEVKLSRLGIAGPLRIGIAPSLAMKFMPALMNELLQRAEPVALTIVEGLDDHLSPALLAGKLDLVLGPLADVFPVHPDIVEEVLFEDRFSIGLGPKHGLRNRRSLNLQELADYPWVLPLPGNHYRRHIEALFMTEGVPWPSDCVLTSSLSLVESILAQNDRVSMITELQSNLQNTWRIRSVPLNGAGKRTIGIKWRRVGALSAFAQHFVRTAHAVVRAGPIGAAAGKRRRLTGKPG